MNILLITHIVSNQLQKSFAINALAGNTTFTLQNICV